MTPGLQERHFDYVLGPNQDSRLASVAPGAVITEILLQLDPDAPFILRGRAVRQQYTTSLNQNGLQFLKTRWTGPNTDFRQQDYVLESLQMANFGQMGNPKPIYPNIAYPANGVLRLDLVNSGASTLTNLRFFFRGVKLFPFGAVQHYTYPKRFSGLPFNYQIPVTSLGVSERRDYQLFTVSQDADFVLRGGLATAPFLTGIDVPEQFSEVFIQLMDSDRKPFSNDFIPLDVLFGAGNFPAVIPVGPTPNFIKPFGPGPAKPGLFYPEIYVSANHQLIYNLLRADSFNATAAQSFTINLIGQKVFAQ